MDIYQKICNFINYCKEYEFDFITILSIKTYLIFKLWQYLYKYLYIYFKYTKQTYKHIPLFYIFTISNYILN